MSTLRMAQQSTPTTPASGNDVLFFDNADGVLKFVDSTGTVHVVGAGGGTPVLVGIGTAPLGAAQVAVFNEGLQSATPVPSLMDAVPNGQQGSSGYPLFQGLAKSGSILLAGGFPPTTTFLGHSLNLIYRSTDNGQTWTGIATPWDAGIGSGSFVAALAFGSTSSVVVATGTDQNGNAGVLKSTDGGLTWTAVTTPVSAIAGQVSSVAFDGTLWYIAAGGLISGHGLWSSPDLVTWTAHTTGIDGENVFSVTATSTVVLAGCTPDVGVVTNFLARSTNQGSTWTNPTIPGLSGGSFPYPAIAATDGAGNWLAWCSAALSQSLDNGATWSTTFPLPTFATSNAFAFLAGTGWVWVGGGSSSAIITYTAPVANPLVMTPVGYLDHTIQPPAVLVAI